MEIPSATLRRLPLAFFAFLAILAAYANHGHNSFHFDDFHTIVDNPSVRSLRNIPRFFTDAATFSVLPANRTWRPVLSTTLALDYRIAHGYNPLWFHVTSFVFFLLQLVCMYVLFCRTLTISNTQPAWHSRVLALLATTLYGLHPAIAETVNYIVQRGDILSTLGVVAALALYLRLPGLRRTGLYLVPLALGLLSKPPALIFPALLLAWLALFAPDEARRPRRMALAVAPSFVLTAGLLLLAAHLTPKSYAPTDISPAAYLLTQPYVALRDFATFFLPIHLNVDTDLQPFHSFTPQAAAGFLFLLVLLAVISFTAARKPLRPIAFGLIWFFLGLLPTSLYPLAEVENDHRLYLPFVGLAFAVTCALGLLYRRVATTRAIRLAAKVTAVAVLALCGWGTHRRNQVWRTEETLWADDVAKSPQNGRGLMMYGLTQMQKGDLPRALDLFERAHRYTPNYATLEVNLGVVYAALRVPDAAEEHFLRALALSPTDDLPHLYYGRFLLQQDRLPEAISQLRTAILLNPARDEPHLLLAEALAAPTPNTPEAWLNLSLSQYQQHLYPECIASARRALALRPGYAEAQNNIGAASAALGQYDAAIQADTAALRLQPDFPLARNNLAWAIRQKRLHPN